MPRLVRIATSVLPALCLAGAVAVHAQGVAINGTGAAADTSAILDLASTSKGLLPPRMTAVQRAAIVTPATGLLVWQSDGTAGLYANTGTPATPAWQLVGANATPGQWSVSGSNLYYSSGGVGIGTPPTNGYGLMIIEPSAGLRVQTNNAGSSVASFGGLGTFGIDASGVIGGRFMVLENGDVGIGNASPTNPLSFAQTTGKKISLYRDNGGNDDGLGVAGFRLQLYGAGSNADVALGYDVAGTFNERFAVKPNGALAVSGDPGTAGELLQSGGSGAAASWVSSTNAQYNNTYQAVSQSSVQVSSSSGDTPVPGMSQSVVLAGNAKVLVNFSVYVLTTTCFGCAGTDARIAIYVDGGHVNYFYQPVPSNGGESTITGSQVLVLAAGTHTVDLRASVAAGPDMVVGPGGGFVVDTMILQVMQQ